MYTGISLGGRSATHNIHQVTRRVVGFADEVVKLGELTPILVRVIACVEATLVLLMAVFVLCTLLFAIQVNYLCHSLSAPET